MGSENSALSSNIQPIAILNDIPNNIKSMACNIESVLILSDSKVLHLKNYDGKTTVRRVSLMPNCCCATSNGWAIGFTNGTLSEFDKNLNLITTYRQPGDTHAHDEEIVKVMNNEDDNSLCHLISMGKDYTLNFWDHNGNRIFFYKSKYEITSFCATPFFVFVSDNQNKIHTIDIDSQYVETYTVPSSAKKIVSLGEGFASLAALNDGSIVILSESEIVETFHFPITDEICDVLPLVVEYGTGLITYLTMKKDGKIFLRALEENVGEVGESTKLYAESTTHIVTTKDNNIVVYIRDDFETISMQFLPNIYLPRTKIAKFLMRQ